MIRFATIGSNFIVHRFLEAAEQVSDFSYVAAYSRTHGVGEELAKQYGATQVYTDLQALAQASDIDAVYVASPNALHKTQAILMMKHGKHVLCEKPIASNALEFEEMERVAKVNDVVLMEAMKSVHCPGFDAIKDHLFKLGIIRNVTFNFLQYSSRYDKYKNGIVENAFKPELSNGALMDIGVYPIHVLLALFGMPKSVQSSGIKLDNGADASGTILCKYDGFLATLIYSKIASFEGNQIQGEAATMVIDKISDIKQVEILYPSGRKEEVAIEKQTTMVYEIEKFVQAIRTNDTSDLLATTRAQMVLLDEVRGQLGIVFPADENKIKKNQS